MNAAAQRQPSGMKTQLVKKISSKEFESNEKQTIEQRQGFRQLKDDTRIVSPENIFFQDNAKPREMRRTVAEDPNWDLAIVKDLKLQCLDYIIKNFAEVFYLLERLPLKLKIEVQKRLPISLPLSITFPLIGDQDYWARCCKDRWRICDVKKYGGSWKRLYAEKTLQEMIENFMPGSSDEQEIKTMLALVKDEIVQLDIRQMLPLLKYLQKGNADVTNENKNNDDDDDDCDDNQIEHLDLASLLPKMSNLEGLAVRYAVKDCGMNFDWNLFKFTLRDCYNLSRCIAFECKWLKRLNISNNNIDDEKIRLFVGHILDHPSLEELDLSSNKICDSGGRAVAKMLTKGGVLKKLNLTDNQLKTEGAKAFASALVKNRRLASLQLRLNRLGDEGIVDIFEALTANCDLADLDLSACEMTEASVSALHKVLTTNASLQTLNISANALNEKSGRRLLEAIGENKSLSWFDVRHTNISQDVEILIVDKIKNNNEARKTARSR